MFQELYKKSKQTSDLPDVLGTSKAKKSKTNTKSNPSDSGNFIYRYFHDNKS